VTASPGTVTVHLLADLPDLIEPVGDLRWREWGRPPEPVDRSWWIGMTRHEAGRAGLPVTWVAVDAHGQVAGAVGLGECDIEERRGEPPWLMGMIVRGDLRGHGIGRRLLAQVEDYAAAAYPRVWVANEGPAVGFYQRCSYRVIETLRLANGAQATVLAKDLPPGAT
jgi:GNAT superfamily N-acetyltransferase